MRKITIITVTYNDKDALLETINSLKPLKKNYHQYIVIDGGSSDGTLEVIKKNLELVDKWVSEKDNGIYDAMNKGWALADIDSHIIYLGAGDKLLAIPSIEGEDENTIMFGNVWNELGSVFMSRVSYRLVFVNTIHHQALLIPKKINPTPPFDTKFKVYADFDFNQRLYRRNEIFKFNENLKGYATSNGVSAEFNKKEMFAVTLKNYGFCKAILSRLWIDHHTLRYFTRKKLKAFLTSFFTLVS